MASEALCGCHANGGYNRIVNVVYLSKNRVIIGSVFSSINLHIVYGHHSQKVNITANVKTMG